MISSQWRNVCTVVASVVLMLVAMVQIVLALALNLKSGTWTVTTSPLIPEKTRITTGINIVIDSLVIFPAAWTGICAAVSRHRGVYIALTVITSLAFLGSVGGLVDIAWEFGSLFLFSDAGSDNDEIAIALLVFQSLLILASAAVLAFAIVALNYRLPRDEHHKYRSREHLVEKPYQYPAAIGYPAPAIAPASAPARPYSTLGDYRPLTRGAPEWDRFYEQYFSGGDDYRRKEKRRTNSYRY